MKIVALAGGVGGARFLRGLRAGTPGAENPSEMDPGIEAEIEGEIEAEIEAEITVIGNTGDDITLYGLRVCPDLDTIMYTLGGGIHEAEGWGRDGETFAVQTELAAYGVEPQWFSLGDRDMATHIARTSMLGAGKPLSEVTEALCARWEPGVRLLPMSDDPVETHVVIDEPEAPNGHRAVHFQEYWVRLRAAPPARAVAAVGAEQAKPAPGVLEAVAEADVILFPPSNPVVSIGTILAVPGIRDAIVASAAPVVGLSPIIGNGPVRGMADKVLAAVGVEATAAAVARHYGPGLLDGWLVHSTDVDAVAEVEDAGIKCRAVPLLMTDVATTAAMARAALALAEECRELAE